MIQKKKQGLCLLTIIYQLIHHLPCSMNQTLSPDRPWLFTFNKRRVVLLQICPNMCVRKCCHVFCLTEKQASVVFLTQRIQKLCSIFLALSCTEAVQITWFLLLSSSIVSCLLLLCCFVSFLYRNSVFVDIKREFHSEVWSSHPESVHNDKAFYTREGVVYFFFFITVKISF